MIHIREPKTPLSHPSTAVVMNLKLIAAIVVAFAVPAFSVPVPYVVFSQTPKERKLFSFSVDRIVCPLEERGGFLTRSCPPGPVHAIPTAFPGR